MKVTFGEEGLGKSWQKEFSPTTECCRCSGKARIAFVAHEGMSKGDKKGPFLSGLHPNEGKEGGYWLHDACAVAVYLCRDCLEPTALYNQG